MCLKKINDEVYYYNGEIVKVNKNLIEELKEKAMQNKRKRVRLCAHKNVKDKLHEMIIFLGKETYIRPHKHPGKSESFHVIQGSADIIIFDDKGEIIKVIPLGKYSSNKNFFYRISEPLFHTVLVNSEFLLYHETTNGPFEKKDAIFAKWAPDENDLDSGVEFKNQLRKAIK